MHDKETDFSQEDEAVSLLAAAMPGTPRELAQRLLMDAAGPLGISGDPADAEDDAAKVAASLQMLRAASPRDALEAMLAVQMAGCHAAAMRALRRATECAGHPQIEALYARQAARLMALFVRQTEALERRQGRVAAEADAEAAEADGDAAESRPIAAALPGKSRPPHRPKHPDGRSNGKRNGAISPPPNGRRHRINGAAPPR